MSTILKNSVQHYGINQLNISIGVKFTNYNAVSDCQWMDDTTPTITNIDIIFWYCMMWHKREIFYIQLLMVSNYIGTGLSTKTTSNNEMYNEVVNQEDFEYMEETDANNEAFQIDWIINLWITDGIFYILYI